MNDCLTIAVDCHLVMPIEPHPTVFMPLCSLSHIDSGLGSDTCQFQLTTQWALPNCKTEGRGVAGKCDASALSQDWLNTNKFLFFGSPSPRFLPF